MVDHAVLSSQIHGCIGDMSQNTSSTHRQVLSSLLASIFQSGRASLRLLDDQTFQLDGTEPSADFRELLLTLHVIFPELTLPALNLLDRRLVQRLQLNKDMTIAALTNHPNENLSHGGMLVDDAAQQTGQGVCEIYSVRSLASVNTSRRVVDDAIVTLRTHIVHLAAWHCSCTEFNLDKFCRQNRGEDVLEIPHAQSSIRSEQDGRDPYWPHFAGGRKPLCKHLLACLFAKNWRPRLMVEEAGKSVSRPELASFIASA